MHFHPLHMTLFLSALTLGLPFEATSNNAHRNQIAPRAKSYAIVNVDGGSTSSTAPPPPQPTKTITDSKTKTETVEVPQKTQATTPATSTDIIPSTTAPPSLPSSASSTAIRTTSSLPSANSTTASSFAKPSQTESSKSKEEEQTVTIEPTATATETVSVSATPSVITVVVTESGSPETFYDDGMWHTRYAIKTGVMTRAAVPSGIVSSA